MSTKTISLNTALFSAGGLKTKKNREKKLKNATPLISPNVLKKKLLKRIKEHKQHETEHLDNNTKNTKSSTDLADNIPSFSNEFSDSLKYLQTLAEDKKHKEQSIKRKENLEKNTVKNYQSLNTSASDYPLVNLDLPEELFHNQPNKLSTNTQPMNNTTDQVPYGILKGGTKPLYRDWRKTQRNHDVTNPNLALTIEGNVIDTNNSVRENRLNNLREKLKREQQDAFICQKNIIVLPQNIATNNDDSANSHSFTKINDSQIIQPSQPIISDGIIIAVKRITKKTSKRKYTLGKSHIKKTVAVLIKDRKTRKRVLDAQKDLKKKSINDIKTYLRDHNLIKIGSNAPNDIIRKTYESAMMTGEIMNNNVETLLHNFSKDDKQL